MILATAVLSSYAQTEVNAFFTGANEGVTYSLPDTKIEVILKATCVKESPGEFSRYADRYLRVKDAIKETSSYWELTDARIETVGTPSPEKRYTIKLNSSSASNITLDEQGIIVAINAKPSNDNNADGTASERQKLSEASKYMTEEMLQASSTAKLAELTAKEIYSIRESKLAITRGQAENSPRDGQAMQLMLEELDKQERTLTELFTGRIDTLTQEVRFIIEPNEECDTTKAMLLRFSHKLGFLTKENLAGEPVYYNLRDLKSIKRPTAEELKKRKPIKKEGICYNIPGKAEVEVYTRTRKLAKAEVPIAQLGTTEVLSKSFFNKNNNTMVIFNASTGGIISIEKK